MRQALPFDHRTLSIGLPRPLSLGQARVPANEILAVVCFPPSLVPIFPPSSSDGGLLPLYFCFRGSWVGKGRRARVRETLGKKGVEIVGIAWMVGRKGGSRCSTDGSVGGNLVAWYTYIHYIYILCESLVYRLSRVCVRFLHDKYAVVRGGYGIVCTAADVAMEQSLCFFAVRLTR